MTVNIIRYIINYMIEERGVNKRFIAKRSGVPYGSLSSWTSNKLEFNQRNINKLQDFIKEYHFVSSIDEVLQMFNKK